MSQAIGYCGVNKFYTSIRQSIFIYLDLDVRLLRVCQKWKAEIHATLLTYWNHLPSTLDEAKKSVQTTDSSADYFKLFSLLNKHFVAELRHLDEESPRAFRTAFCGLLTPRRFIEMQKKIIVIQHTRAFWARLRRQNESLADIPSIPLMNKELGNPTRKRVFAKLNQLDLGGIGFEEIPPQAFLLSKLTHLDLSNNQLIDLPDEIQKLRNLVSINLTGNPLATDASKHDALVRKLAALLPLLREIILGDKVIELAPATKPSSCSNCKCIVQ